MDSRNRSLMFWGILGEDYSRWLNIPLYGLPPSPNVGLRQIFWNPSKHHWNIVHTRFQATITLTSPTISGFNSTLYFPIHYMWPTRVCCGLDPPKSNQIILESELTFEVWRKSLSVFETSSSHNCTTQKHNAFWPAYHWYRGKKNPHISICTGETNTVWPLTISQWPKRAHQTAIQAFQRQHEEKCG